MIFLRTAKIRGYGENLIWARMNIYETELFEMAYQQAPELTIRDNVHVGVEVSTPKGQFLSLHFSDAHP